MRDDALEALGEKLAEILTVVEALYETVKAAADAEAEAPEEERGPVFETKDLA